ncbi:MAG: NTP transferase domain-containing protein [Ignavibacteriae bacterium]|nr:NTP transferase domain-containing protein [Ignavibacteria bacterium]MBI3363462.1 NTP transferase domain-containing protein [Ignavibacteriota bacterium]
MISGIVLAEQFIPEQDDCERMVRALNAARILDIVIVLGRQSEEARHSLTNWFTGKLVVNDQWEASPLQSIVKGFDTLDQTDLHGAIICPITQPHISQAFLVDLLQAFWKSHKRIVVPVLDGIRSLPVIFDAMLIEEMKTGAVPASIEDIISRHPDDVIEVPALIELTKESRQTRQC